MLNVLSVVRRFFWNDCLYDRSLLPSEANLAKCQVTLADLATMTGAGRVAIFEECGIHSSLHPVFIRALQHLTAIHGPGAIIDNYMMHHHLSAENWSPFVSNTPLLGYSTVVSDAFVADNNGTDTFCLNNEVFLNDNATNKKVSYNGLLNQGATCYLNSLLQALFHISEFRWTIYQMPTLEEVEEKNEVNTKRRKTIPYALQRLFCLLQIGHEAVDTTELTESFGWSSTDSFIQHDVHELTCELLDNLEKKLKNVQQPEQKDLTKPDKNNAIGRLFVGVLENIVRVDEVGYCGTREELFSDLRLVVKETSDVYASLERLFQVEILDGKNKYCLELDGKKSYHRAEKYIRLKTTPPILLLHLTRFDYDTQKGETKVLSRWEYYNTLDLSTYMPHASKDDTHYTLCSVLVHSGSDTRFGHYFCFIMCSGVWYKFNDEVVSQASLTEVFGSNFGGFKINYWGSEVPNTANAYMLVYVRTSEMGHLLRPIGWDDVPLHVVKQLEQEQKERERLLKEQEEDHLYGKVHFIQPQDLAEDYEPLYSRKPKDGRLFPTQKSLRVLLSLEALPEFYSFVEKEFGIPSCEQQLWFFSARDETGHISLHTQVTTGLTVLDILCGEKECCILVISSSNAHHISVDGDDVLKVQLFHHKLYLPLQLRIVFLGCTVLSHRRSVSSAEAVRLMEPFVWKSIMALPKDPNLKPGHHLLSTGATSMTDFEPTSTVFLEPLFEKQEPLPQNLEKEREKSLSVLREEGPNSFSQCSEFLRSGDILLWQETILDEEKDNIFYPDIVSFQHFLRYRIPVEIKLNLPTFYPTLIDTQLASDMNYEQLQRYVAFLIDMPQDYDRIRFATHNPETKQPYFLKGKKRDRPTLIKLLSPLTQNRTPISRYLYYEYCKYTVTEIEAAHSLQFKLFSERVKPLSEHWVLLPRGVSITSKELFGSCVNDIKQSANSCIASCSTTQFAVNNEEKDRQQEAVSDPDILFYKNLAPNDAWKVLRLVDVWRGRIYNVFDKDHPQAFERSTFEESSEYRIERLPTPIEGVSLECQSLIQVHHFTMVRHESNSVETHGNPFSIYIAHDELAPALLRRIANKLGLSEAAVVDWKMALVRESCVVEVLSDIPMGKQLLEFCHERQYQPNGKDPLKMAFLGLEHAPLSKRSLKKEDKVVILN